MNAQKVPRIKGKHTKFNCLFLYISHKYIDIKIKSTKPFRITRKYLGLNVVKRVQGLYIVNY